MLSKVAYLVSSVGQVRRASWRLSQPAAARIGLIARTRSCLRSARQAIGRAAVFVSSALGMGPLARESRIAAGRIRTALAPVKRVLVACLAGLVPAAVRRLLRSLWQGAKRLLGLRALDRFMPWLRRRLHGRNFLLRLIYWVVRRQRDLVRRFARQLAEPSWRLATSNFTTRYLRLASRLERGQSRFFARLMFRTSQYLHITILGIQLASGHSDRSLKLARTLNLFYRHVMRERRRPGCHMYFEALFRTMRFDRIVAEVPAPEMIDDHHLNHQVAVAHLYALNADSSIEFMQRAIAINDGTYSDYRMLGRAYLVKGERENASRAFARSVELMPKTVMAHQNYAGRYDVHSYKPKPFELERAGELLIYDNLGQFAEDLFLQGRFHDSFRFYQQMLDYQSEIAPQANIPVDIIRRLSGAHKGFDPDKPMRLLPYEWVIQFGHIGLLDIYMKMARLGMYPEANYVLLAPREKIANQELLRYWERHYTIVRDAALVDDLFPYQRYIGDNFMAYPATGGEAEPWTRAGARAQVMWAEQKRGPLISLNAEDRAYGLERLRKLGVPDGAWYVGLHVREGGFYAEASSGMSAHRNATIEDYVPAIEETTRRGGYVIRLGDKSMRPMTPMKQVVDYAVSDQKSATMDLFLVATSRFVIGTTSGLTTATLAFGRPMVLVNCISNDWQLWSDDTDFIPKRLRERRSGRYLSLSETYRQPIQGYLINNVVTNRRGYIIDANTQDEITAAVRYKLDIVEGHILRPDRNHPTVAAYRRAMADNPFMFGAAHPVPAFLEMNSILLQAPPLSMRPAT